MTDYFELRLPPQDGISSLNFIPQTNLLLVTSWDTSVRCYDTTGNVQRWQYNHDVAVLDGCVQDKSRVFSSDISGRIKSYDVASGVASDIGSHEKGVRALAYNHESQLLFSGGWDGILKAWDVRDPHQPKEMHQHNLEAQIFTMSTTANWLVVGTADKMITIFDTRQMQQPVQKRESSIKFQTRCIRTFIDGSGYALASVEGRIGMEYFDPKEQQAKKYAFKCHRANEAGVDVVYPVNTIAFHPIYGTFATGGCDGNVYYWDGQNRKRLFHLKHYPTSISALAFNSEGNLLAVASSYTYEEGEKDHPNDQIFIHTVNEKIKPFGK
ncbi:WD40 repeat-containing protein [Heterostelium album PN500]|uniref:WD40 repeat-containing protein n=1 Tax=Heterostelium pallidum (strain ATCC 26659 / Pp 5 / PN500) TaxID=670386 RepID=D3B2L6_HETP5|nr:WD40 repeat-containing protein [Heterostelium album PN500]EFA83564.1 WD40 repeat-containing protein [Heterostelium album PN500]|eukprot:XP_020435681.1 WD40 repeat-containing protein [Heterostelium album PN500]